MGRTLHFAALFALIGGPVFWWTVWRPAAYGQASAAHQAAWRRLWVGLWFSATLFALTGLSEALATAAQVVPLRQLDFLLLFLSRSRVGQMALGKLLLVPVLLWAFRCWARTRPGSPSQALWPALAGLAGLGLLATISAVSHAAAMPGLWPLVSDVIHLAAGAVWGGGLFYFACLPWAQLRPPRWSAQQSAALVDRFSRLGLGAVLALTATGLLASFLHLYGPGALTTSTYGRLLAWKLASFLALLLVAGANLLWVGPGLRQRAARPAEHLATWLRRLAWLVRAEAALILTVLAITASLSRTPPPEGPPPQIPFGSWQLQADGQPMQVDLSPAGPRGRARFDVYVRARPASPMALPSAPALPAGTRVVLELVMADHPMGVTRLQAQPVTADHFVAEALLEMGGNWQLTVRLQSPGQAPRQDQVLVSIPADHTTMLHGHSPGPSWPPSTRGVAVSVVGLAFLLGGGWAIRAGRHRLRPLWWIPAGTAATMAGLAALLGGLWWDPGPAVPSRNPLPATAEALSRGRELFQANCAACHGLAGQGDGPNSQNLPVPPADLTAPHVDAHSDGDLFTVISRGTPRGMPGFAGTLPEDDRWRLVHYVRQLRRARPEPPSGPTGAGATPGTGRNTGPSPSLAPQHLHHGW